MQLINLRYNSFIYLFLGKILQGLRVIELSEALNVDTSDLLALCAILKLKASTRLSILTFEECKEITDYYEKIF